MQALDLRVHDRVRQKLDAVAPFHRLVQGALARLFGGDKFGNCGNVLNIFGQSGNFFQILPPAVRPFVEEGGKRLVAQFQPAARRDAVRLVAELFGVIFRRGGEQIALDDVGMQLRHAVDAAADEHGEARHAVGFSRADRHLRRLLRRTAEGSELPPRERIQPL